MFIAFYVILAMVVISVIVAMVLRTAAFDQQRTADELEAPLAKTVSYVVPEGQDPAVLMAQLQAAGYTSVVENHGNDRLLLVGYSDVLDRQRVREVIERVHTTTVTDGASIDVGHVSFTDER